MKNLYSISSFLLATITSLFLSFSSISQCDYVITMVDSYGDGWNGASIDINVQGVGTTSVTVPSGGSNATANVATIDGANVTFTWNSGSYDSEVSFDIVAPNGTSIWASGAPPAGQFASDVSNAPGCVPPICTLLAPAACAASASSQCCMGITNVVLGSINNSSGFSNADYSCSMEAFLEQGQSFSFSASVGGGYAMYMRVGFDWNNDGDFDDANEIEQGFGTIASNGTVSRTITVPANATEGPVRVRLHTSSNAYGTTINSISGVCGVTSYGDVEEYMLVISAPSGCSGTPTAGTASLSPSNGLSGSTVSASASGIESGSFFSYQWQESSDNASWSDVGGATMSSATFTPSVSTYFRLVTTCST